MKVVNNVSLKSLNFTIVLLIVFQFRFDQMEVGTQQGFL